MRAWFFRIAGSTRPGDHPHRSTGSCGVVTVRGVRATAKRQSITAPPVSSWPMAKAEQRSPFAPALLQGLPHYWGLLRPCAPHRYSRPRGWSRLRLLPSRRRRDGAQVLMFHAKAPFISRIVAHHRMTGDARVRQSRSIYQIERAQRIAAKQGRTLTDQSKVVSDLQLSIKPRYQT
jgi:hypothetical protein